jgi:Flp pilus assembly protein CpaB
VTTLPDRLRDVASRLGRDRTPHLRRQRIGLRRFLAAGLAAAAASLALPVLAPPAPVLEPVVVAARAIAAGHELTAEDLRVIGWAGPVRPASALGEISAATGRTTAGPLEPGSVVTESQLLGPGLLTGQPADLLAVPVRLADPAAALLVRRGDRVDVIASARGVPVVSAAIVLARVAGGSDAQDGWGGLGGAAAGGAAGGAAGLSGGAVVVLGVGPTEAGELARAQAEGALAVAVHPSSGDAPA